MAYKKKLKLKKNIKKIFLYFIVFLVLSVFLINKYKEYKYHQTNEYKLICINYTLEEANKIEASLSKKQIKDVIERQKKDSVLLSLINEKYFLKKNLDAYKEYYKSNTETSFQDVVAIINVGANEDWYYKSKEADTTKDELILVNKFHLLKEDYTVDDVVNFEGKYSYGEVSASKKTHDAFVKMADAARKDDISLIVTSGYRSYARQDEIYKEIRNVNGKIYADGFAARAGASEHETGLALDVFTYSATTDNFESTNAYKWLDTNAQNYGFILRYPKDKKYLTGYTPESWHFRYVGVETAKKVKSLGITYDEYYAYFLDK